ncbi:hypothetical protein [Streptomyces venezuelae]|nr:hypothetical protein [Streptomyces venezuelae]
MHDTEEEEARWPWDVPVLAPPRPPPLRLAGIDEDDTWEPHLVRGID